MRDRATLFIAFCDLLFAILAVVIVAVAPVKAKTDGVKEKAEYLLTIEWSVDIDADADIWLIPPSKKPVFYASRDVGCARLDSDNRGFMDAIITLADGSKTRIESDKETIQLRCIEPGRYDLGVNLYAYRDKGLSVGGRDNLGLKVHVEIVGLNPAVKTLFAKDVTLDRVHQTINVTSFDLAPGSGPGGEGRLTLADPPLEPVTARAYRGAP